jgi:hypothetical protein
MSIPWLPPVDALATFALLWLLLLGLGERGWPPATVRAKIALAVLAFAGLLIPVGGLTVWAWIFSLHPNPSVPLLGLLLVLRFPRFLGFAFFHRPDWNATWLFGAGVGSVLYLPPMFGGGVDIYVWGWDTDVAIWTLAGVTVLLLALGNRLGVLLLAALPAFAAGMLESVNCWDYVIDPIYWLVSLGILIRRGWFWILQWRPATAAEPALEPDAMIPEPLNVQRDPL